MTRSIWIRNVPDALYRTLSARAAATGHSLPDFLLAEIERLAERPAISDVLLRASSRSGGAAIESITWAVRTGRQSV